MRRIFVALALTLPLFARDTRKDLIVDLKFSPQEGVQSNAPDLTPSVTEKQIALKFEDARGGDLAVIGQGTNDDDAAFSIKSATSVLEFVQGTTKQVADNWGVKLDDNADRILTLRLTRYSVDESNKAVGSVYAAEVQVGYVLSDKSGRKLMEGATTGSAHRYGRARSVENCNEVLSDSLKEALADTLSDARLQEAWSSGKASGSTAASTESVEERLRKLDDLLKKGLITKEEYDKKRAEILKDI